MDGKDKRDELDVVIHRAIREGRNPRDLPVLADANIDEHLLLRFVEGVASADEASVVTAAFDADPGLAQQVELLKDALAEPGHAAAPIERATRYVFHLAADALTFVRGATAPIAAPQLAWTTRNGQTPAANADSFYELRHEFGDMTCVLKVEQTTTTAKSVGLEVTVLKDARAQPSARVTLRRGEQVIDSSPVNNRGSVSFAALAPAHYAIEIAMGEHEKAKLDLDLLC